MSKYNAANIITKIGQFNHSFSLSYPIASKYYIRNETNEIDVTDGIEALEYYLDSKLKRKDDHNFSRGIEKIIDGLNGIKSQLEREVNNL